MLLTNAQRETAQGIVAIFETGKLPSAAGYGTVTNIAGDSGGFTYGIHQTTINSGNLYLLLKAYAEAEAEFSSAVAAYLPRVRVKDRALAQDAAFKALLKNAGLNDPKMREVQDAFFDRVFWQRALTISEQLGLKKALSATVVYDSVIHGSWDMIYKRTVKSIGAAAMVGETAFIRGYNEERRAWLAGHGNPVLRKCIYRQNTFRSLISGSNWDLDLPLNLLITYANNTTAKVLITAEKLGVHDDEPDAPEPVRLNPAVEDEEDQVRLLDYIKGVPLMVGEDVKKIQLLLIGKGFSVGKAGADGFYGEATDVAVKMFQTKHGIKADGIVGPATRAKLGILV